jgi:nitroreductase
MEVIEAIKGRQSVRAFKPEPVSTQTLRDILEVAIHAPSGVNAQPWEFFIVKGEVLDTLKAGCVEQFQQGIGPRPDLPLPDKEKGDMGLQGIYRKRQVSLGIQIFKVLGIAKGDRQAMMDYMEQMYRFFEAPAVIIIVVDEMFKLTWPMIDVGALTQSIALTALEFDLGTCIMRAIVDYPAKVKEIVGIPESKKIILGLTIGRPDWDHPINQFRSVREDLENLLTVVE